MCAKNLLFFIRCHLGFFFQNVRKQVVNIFANYKISLVFQLDEKLLEHLSSKISILLVLFT